jgi:hypothetical protein
MEVDTRYWALLDFRIDLAGINQTVFATHDPIIDYYSLVTSPTMPQFPLIVNVPFNITFKIVDDTTIEVSRHKSKLL